MDFDSKDFVAKILIVGDSEVGKTSILNRFTDNTFQTDTVSTVGVDCRRKKVSIKNETIDLHVWDTSGQERFRCITRNFYRDCTGIIIVFDLTNTQTFKNVQLWLDQINAEVDDSVTKILVGNKLDLNREVGIDDVQNLMEDYNLPYFETSAMTGGNIGHLFTFMATILHDKSMERTGASTIDFTRVESERISLTSSGQKSPKKNQKVKNDGCCS